VWFALCWMNMEVWRRNLGRRKVWWILCRCSFKTGSKLGSMSSKEHSQQTAASIRRIVIYSDR